MNVSNKGWKSEGLTWDRVIVLFFTASLIWIGYMLMGSYTAEVKFIYVVAGILILAAALVTVRSIGSLTWLQAMVQEDLSTFPVELSVSGVIAKGNDLTLTLNNIQHFCPGVLEGKTLVYIKDLKVALGTQPIKVVIEKVSWPTPKFTIRAFTRQNTTPS